MAQTDISFWAKKRIEEVAKELLKKVSKKAGWKWETKYHEGDEESRLGAHWTLEGESKKLKLSVFTYLGNVPWTTIWKLYFTKDGREYFCLEEKFQEIPSLKELEIKLDSIGRQVRQRQDAKEKRVTRNSDKAWSRQQDREAKTLISSLRE